VNVRFWLRAGGSFARNLRHKEFVSHVATAGLRADAEPKAAEIMIFKAYPEIRGLTVQLGGVRYLGWNIDPLEQFCLAAIAMVRSPKRIFEFGTFDGSTSLLLARTLPDAHVYTLDLPPEEIRPEGSRARAHAAAGGVGSWFHGQPEADRITQLYGDSRTFDFDAYVEQIDLVVVDGGHRADCVIPDTEHALQMVAPGGIVIWDDYTPAWPDVVRAVDDAAKRHHVQVIRIMSTDLAVFDASKS
jgi:predicted O-methyltransferase YrrM